MQHEGDGRRLPALDGLRGIAALIVLMTHALLISPVLALAYLKPDPGRGSAWAQAFTYSPAHLLWAGTEAVYVFFVLSGFVLALTAGSLSQPPWRRYYPQRLLRLYLPIVVAVALSYLLMHVGRRTPHREHSWWLNHHPGQVAVHYLVRDVTVVRGAGATNSALWSLQWEVIFSLLLPVFLLVTVRLRTPFVLHASAVLALVVGGLTTGHLSLFYLGIFGCGVVMARHRAVLQHLGEQFDAAPVAARAAFVVLAGLFLTDTWSLLGAGHRGALGPFLAVVGATALVWLFAATAWGRSAGTGPAVAWVGRRSFSLYLVHEPIVVTTAILLGRHGNALTVLALALPLSLLVAAAFHRLVEQPAHRAARWTGRLVLAAPHRRAVAPVALVAPG